VGVGREVLDTIGKLDRQIDALPSDVDPQERTRLEEKVKALGAAPVETQPRQRMRQLLEQQLELARSLARQLDAAQDRRARLVELLKTLWLQIANLGAHERDVAFDSTAITDRIRAITEDARRYADATAEVSGALTPD
jgi:chromosome segregation ATPase